MSASDASAVETGAVEPHDAVDVIRAKRDGGTIPEDALRWHLLALPVAVALLVASTRGSAWRRTGSHS